MTTAEPNSGEQPAERCVRLGHDPATNLAGEVKCLDCGVVLTAQE